MLMISQHGFRWLLGAVRQQTITWTNTDQVIWRQMALIVHDLKALIASQNYAQFTNALTYLHQISHTDASWPSTKSNRSNMWHIHVKISKFNSLKIRTSPSAFSLLCVTLIFRMFWILNIGEWYDIDSTNLGQRIDSKGLVSSVSEAQGWTGQGAAHEKTRLTP